MRKKENTLSKNLFKKVTFLNNVTFPIHFLTIVTRNVVPTYLRNLNIDPHFLDLNFGFDKIKI